MDGMVDDLNVHQFGVYSIRRSDCVGEQESDYSDAVDREIHAACTHAADICIQLELGVDKMSRYW